MKSVSKKTMGLLAVLASVGVVHADEGKLEIKEPTEGQKVVVERLVRYGFLSPLEDQSDWYQINRPRLEEAFFRKQAGDKSAVKVIDMLQRIAGPEVNIRGVDIFKARMGSQDFVSVGNE